MIRRGATVAARPTAKGHQVIRSVLDAWPTRRRVAAAAFVPLVAAWFALAGRSTGGNPSAGWYALSLAAATLGAAVLASYVPAEGRKPDLGCSPCATMSALTVVGATVALRTYGADVAGPLVAIAVLLFGLAQRMNQPTACVTR